MPNWCSNTVEITGKKKEIEKIKNAILEDKFLNYLYPMPVELENTVADGSENKSLISKTGYSDWYGWRTNNWCTKWEVDRDCGEPIIEDVDKDISILSWSFNSAWSPPTGAYEYYLDMNPNMKLFATYYEPAMDFMGVYDSGDERTYLISNYNSEDKFWKTREGSKLDELYGILEWMEESKAEESVA